MKIKKVIIIAVLMFLPVYSMADISLGLSAGYQYDVGNMNEKKGIEGDVQQNLSIGGVINIDFDLFFIRSGAEFSYPFEKGRVSNSVYDIEETKIYFVQVPLYGGFRFPLKYFGSIYMGGGGAYIFSLGKIKTSASWEKVNEQLFGFGFISGVEYNLFHNSSFFIEWEYLSVTGSPVVSTSGVYDDYLIDYSGSRYRFGVTYKLNN